MFGSYVAHTNFYWFSVFEIEVYQEEGKGTKLA